MSRSRIFPATLDEKNQMWPSMSQTLNILTEKFSQEKNL